MFGAGDHGKRIANVEFTEQVEVKFETRDFELGRRRSVADIKRGEGVVLPQAKTFNRAMGDIEERRQIWIIAIAQQQAVARDQTDEMFEGGLDRLEVLENIGMIEFQVIDDRHL